MGSPEARKEVSITLNMASLHGALTHRVQELSQYVSAAFASTLIEEEPPGGFPGTALHYQYPRLSTWNPTEARQGYERWVLLSAFRELADSTGLFLDGVQHMCSVWRLLEAQARSGGVTAADFQRERIDEPKRFQKSFIPIKLRILTELYGLILHRDVLDQILSMNAARNCLVHRGGLVTERDRNCPEGLEVKWVKGLIILKDKTGEREVLPPVTMDGGDQLLLQQQLTSKTFGMGTDISFSSREFADIAWAVSVFGMRVVSAVEVRGRELGVAVEQNAIETTA